MVGPDGRRREVFIMRDGPRAEGRPGGRMMPGAGMDRPGRRGAERMMRLSRELGLTPEQRTKVRGLMEASRPKMEELQGQIRAQRLKLREADPDAKGHDALVASTSKRIGELTAQREQQRAQLRRQVWQLLTPEQRAKAGAKRAEAKKRRDRMERRARELRGTP
jgi:Spy/CpxP family protein refolding chaperone